MNGQPPCPICGRPRVARFKPFCSKRCAELDLGRWLGGRYAIPAAEAPEEGEEAPDQETANAIANTPEKQ